MRAKGHAEGRAGCNDFYFRLDRVSEESSGADGLDEGEAAAAEGAEGVAGGLLVPLEAAGAHPEGGEVSLLATPVSGSTLGG